MNSVIIIGLDMPSNCWECPCMRHDSYDGVNKYQCNVTLDIVGEHNPERRPDWCPLEETEYEE